MHEVGSCTSSKMLETNLLSKGPPKKGTFWELDEVLYNLLPPFKIDSLESEFLNNLVTAYKVVFSGVDENLITSQFQRCSGFTFSGEKFGCIETKRERSSFVLARWCARGGQIDTSGTDLRPGVVDFYMRQNIKVNGKYITCLFAHVRWFQAHPSRLSLGAPVEVWCNDLFEVNGPANFIPVQRIAGKFIPCFDIVEKENVLIVCPLTLKLQ